MTGCNQFSEKISREASEQISREKNTPEEVKDPDMLFLRELRKKIEKELRLLEKIERALTLNDAQNTDRYIRAFLSCNEDSFITGKEAGCLRPIYKSGTEPPERYRLRGVPVDFPASLARIGGGHYKFILPPLTSKKAAEKTFRDGKAIQYLVIHLLQEYENKNGIIRRMDRPLVLFIHNVREWSGKKWVPDADNLDAKTIIDTLQGYFYANDSVLDITLIHAGKLAQDNFTELHLIDPVLGGTQPADNL